MATDKCEPCRENRHAECWQNLPWYECLCPVCRTPRKRRETRLSVGLRELIERFDRECVCDCPDNQDRHVIIECPNRSPLTVWVRVGDWNPVRNFCSTMSRWCA